MPEVPTPLGPNEDGILEDRCENCGETRETHSSYGVELCDDCELVACDNCGDHQVENNMHSDSDGLFCDQCWESRTCCDNCSNGLWDFDSHYMNDVEETWCESCTSRHAYWCDECECYNANECDCEPSSLGHVYQYSYKPLAVFLRAPGQAPGLEKRAYYGMELEIEFGAAERATAVSDLYKTTGNKLENIYLKEDGSLRNGFELVTHPGTLQYWQQWQELDRILNLLADRGGRAWEKTSPGLHVHANKRQFDSIAHMGRFNALFAIADRHWIEKLARRESPYAPFGPNKLAAENPFDRHKTVRSIVSGQTPHSSAVNWSNDKTVEVRIFRPAVEFNRVLTCVSSVAAAVEFSRIITARDIITWSDYTGERLFNEFINYCGSTAGFELIATEASRSIEELTAQRKDR